MLTGLEKTKTEQPTQQRGGRQEGSGEAATQFKSKSENSLQDFQEKRLKSSRFSLVCEFADISMILITLEVDFPGLKQWADSIIISRRCQQILHIVSETLSQKQFLRIYYYFVYLDVLPACTSVYHMHAVCLETKKGLRLPGTGITDGDDLLMCWGPNMVLGKSKQCS